MSINMMYNLRVKTKMIFLFALLLPMLSGTPSAAAEIPQTETRQMDHDPLGVWQSKPKDFEQVKARGAKVVYMPAEQTFFTYWIPPDYKSGRIVVSVHGTGGNPYIAIRDEIGDAGKFDYLAVAISWFSKERGFFPAKDVYRNILQALDFVRSEFGNDLSAVAYIGFSRGAAISYEVAHLDAAGENVFDLFISHSGGIPLDLRIEALNPDSKPDPFFSWLTNGEPGSEVFKGKKFFLYSGDKDESWGPTMSRQVEHAKQLIEGGGGEVLEWVRDSEGGHAGFLRDPAIKEKALRYFIDLTPRGS